VHPNRLAVHIRDMRLTTMGRPARRAAVSKVRAACAFAFVLGCGGKVGENASYGGGDASTSMDATTMEGGNTDAATGKDGPVEVGIETLDGGFVADGELGTASPGPGQTVCGATLCNAAIEVCCLHANGAVSCTGLNACDGSPFVCSGPESCTPWCCYAFFDQEFDQQGLRSTVCQPCDPLSQEVCTQSSQCPDSDPWCAPIGGPGFGICRPGDGG
jgi:hypothetical protein